MKPGGPSVTADDARDHRLRHELGEGLDAGQQAAEGVLQVADVLDASAAAATHLVQLGRFAVEVQVSQLAHEVRQLLERLGDQAPDDGADAYGDQGNADKDDHGGQARLLHALFGCFPLAVHLILHFVVHGLRGVGEGVGGEHRDHQPAREQVKLDGHRANLQAVLIFFRAFFHRRHIRLVPLKVEDSVLPQLRSVPLGELGEQGLGRLPDDGLLCFVSFDELGAVDAAVPAELHVRHADEQTSLVWEGLRDVDDEQRRRQVAERVVEIVLDPACQGLPLSLAVCTNVS
mmetsp:Transcript_21957/g.55927  ORF Transcript_21957/g.55927 Transcript_21957/m.55927 type:complete len:289 (-) Transcript_21957:1461-2327(-)